MSPATYCGGVPQSVKSPARACLWPIRRRRRSRHLHRKKQGPSLPLVKLFPAELPATRTVPSASRKPFELRRLRRGVRFAGELRQVIPDQLIHACAQSFRAASGIVDHLVFNRETPGGSRSPLDVQMAKLSWQALLRCHAAGRAPALVWVRAGTPLKSGPRPSAMVGCVNTASRSAV